MVIKPLELEKLSSLCSESITKLNLVQPLCLPKHTQCASAGECSHKIPPPPVIPTQTNQPLRVQSKSQSQPTSVKRCHFCHKTMKGRRGLNIHLARSPNCKRNVPAQLAPEIDNASLPHQVADAVKGPSTSVESLENLCVNNPLSKIKRKTHNSNNGCKLCFCLSLKEQFVSSSSHRIYSSVIPNNITHVDCCSKNVIYLLTCRKCRLQYVGETIQPIKDRICKHNSCIKNWKGDHGCRILTEHFSQGNCKGATFSVNIIEKLPGDGRGDDGSIDPSDARLRRKKERDWMRKLRTVYPFGLNDRTGDEYMFEKGNENIFLQFPPLPRVKNSQKVRTKNPTSNTFIVDNFIYIINESIRSNLRNTMNLIRVLLSSLKKAHCRILFNSIQDFLSSKHESFRYVQFFDAALDIVKSKIGKPVESSSSSKTPPSNCCHIEFDNKALDFINLNKIFKDKDIRSKLPHNLRDDLPTVVYRLKDTIRSKVFNYKKFVQSIDVDKFINDNSILPCECHSSPFTNAHHGHVITGDLNIVTDNNLRNLLSKGPKYREPLPFSCEKAKHNILNGIDTLIETWSNKASITPEAFKEWRSNVTDAINSRISTLTDSKKKSSAVLSKPSSKSCLDDLQSKYVMVPIDKAANNIAFVCKRYYALVILKELGLISSSSSTYTSINDTPDNIIQQHARELKEQFNITVDDDMMTLPDIYWLPKLHKNPVGFRFIIASKRCTTKKLSKHVSSAFSLFQKQIEKYHHISHFYSGIKTYWIVQNRDPVLEAVKRSKKRKSAKCISSFDFSTLYTKIPHDKLIHVLNENIDFVFKGGTKKKVSVSGSGIARWINDKSGSSYVFTKQSIREAVTYLIQNCYFKLGTKLFRQDIGIPMGSDPAPAFANLFLFHYESKWLNSIKKKDSILARKFGQVFRYIDDLLALNDGRSFEKYFKTIYPEELQLNKENDGYDSSTFLDLDIKIDNGVFSTKLFDKRNDFGFHITRLPFRSSNIPCRMFYSSVAAECLRICRSTSTAEDAAVSIRSIISRMINQGGKASMIKNCISKTLRRHNVNTKLGYGDDAFVNQLFQE